MKYPGGYQIIDLGDLSKIKTTKEASTVVPGIFNDVMKANKPVILTGYNKTDGAANIGAHELALSYWMAFNGAEVFGKVYYASDGSIESIYGLEITNDDYVLDFAYEKE